MNLKEQELDLSYDSCSMIESLDILELAKRKKISDTDENLSVGSLRSRRERKERIKRGKRDKFFQKRETGRSRDCSTDSIPDERNEKKDVYLENLSVRNPRVKVFTVKSNFAMMRRESSRIE